MPPKAAAEEVKAKPKILLPTAKYKIGEKGKGKGKGALPIAPGPPPSNPIRAAAKVLPRYDRERSVVRVLTKYSPKLGVCRKYPPTQKLLPSEVPPQAKGVDSEGNWIVRYPKSQQHQQQQQQELE